VKLLFVLELVARVLKDNMNISSSAIGDAPKSRVRSTREHQAPAHMNPKYHALCVKIRFKIVSILFV
jgi:hypothetical protein